MKLKALSIFGAACAMLALASCGSDKTKETKEENHSIEFETYSFSKIAEAVKPDSIVDLPGAKYLLTRGQGVLPVKIGSTDIKPLRDTLQSLAGVEFPSPGVAAPRIGAEWKLTDLPDSTAACGENYNYLSIAMTTPYIIVWQDYAGEYPCGAAHGMYANRFINYSLRNNQILTLASIMKPGYEQKLTEMLREKLAGYDDIMVERNQIGIPAQFRVTPEGLTFVYGVYEIAPYSSGEIEVPFFLYELESVLSEQGMKLIAAY